MKEQLVVIDTIEDINALREYLKDKEYVAYDSETTGVHKGAEVIGVSVAAEEDLGFYVILGKWNVATNSLVYDYPTAAVTPLIQDLTSKKLIMHNSVFDCARAEEFFKIRLIDALHTDTMILAHLLDENRPVGLKPLSAQYFGENSTAEQAEMKASVLANGGKLTKKDYEMYKCDPYIMGRYGAKDAILTYKLFMQLVPEIIGQRLDKFFYEEESMPLLKSVTYELNTAGLKIDGEALITLQKTLEAECAEAKSYIYSEIEPFVKAKYPGTSKKNTFNIGASTQLSWLLFGQLKLEFSRLTDGGKEICQKLGLRLPYTKTAKNDFIEICLQATGTEYEAEAKVNGKVKRAKKIREPWNYIACDKTTLTKLAPRYKWIERLLEYQRKMKLLSTYVKGIQERTHYGVIYPSFLQHGTTSGRYSSRNPNFQNLPRDDKRVKSCIVARPGKVFVGADYSQLEPRVFAFYSGDIRLLAAFAGTDDFYSVIGMEVYGKTDCLPQKDGPNGFGTKYKQLRHNAKVIALASTYGATANQLAATTGKSIDDTQGDIDAYFEAFPKVKQLMLDSHELAKKEGQVTNYFGRPRRMPEAKLIGKHFGNRTHAELPYEARNILNLAINHRIQSTGASICNRAMIKFKQLVAEAGITDCRIVLQVHDEIVAECLEADGELVSLLLQEAMETAVLLDGINLEAIPKIGKSLGELK